MVCCYTYVLYVHVKNTCCDLIATILSVLSSVSFQSMKKNARVSQSDTGRVLKFCKTLCCTQNKTNMVVPHKVKDEQIIFFNTILLQIGRHVYTKL